MCVDKLIIKQKLSCNCSGLDQTIVFSLAGMGSIPVKFLAVLLKATDTYTIDILSSTGDVIQTKQGQGSGNFEFVLFKNLNLQFGNIFQLHVTSASEIFIYEINMAEICLCNVNEC